jgi:23S rRNA-/tRNA-specific pseudouridylate synthase
VPKLVHRLDKNTTGCLILARNDEAANQVSKLFKTEGMVKKKYLAIVIPPLSSIPVGTEKTIVTGLVTTKSDYGNERVQAIPWNDSFEENAKDIKKAVTKLTILENKKLASLVSLVPLTGKKHQLRVHVTQLDSFILGDYKYGPGCTKKYRHQVSDPKKVPLYLHAYQICIKDWYGIGKDLEVHAPLSLSWKKALMSSGLVPTVTPQICKEDRLSSTESVKVNTELNLIYREFEN